MILSSFEPTNLRSKKVRIFFLVLAFVAAGYALGFALYWFRPAEDGSKPAQLFEESAVLFAAAILLVLFLLTLRWQILRTVILAIALSGLASLYCADVLMLFDSGLGHAIGLVVVGVLFVLLFITQSNLLIYWRDRTWGDVLLEGVIAAAFTAKIAQMTLGAFGVSSA